ncbi:MAG TPA: alpha-amylase family protein [Tepidisphaeraceae bacterium]|nr:alpha-amylase family protein [Tepidisphaeraceae bacterium]
MKKSIIFPLLLLVIPFSQALAQTKWERQAAQKREIAKDITWLTHEPIEFLYRRGDHFDDEADRYARMGDPENIKRMAAAGVKYGRVFFYKGFGLEYEKPDMEKSKRIADLLHQNGMKVSLYMAGTMFTETLYRELPQAQNWEQRDQYNHWVPYGNQTYRHYACPNEPAYREYLKKILKIGVDDLHADEIAFDNVMLQSEPSSCHCERCVAAFHDFLRNEYPTKEAAMRRFGLPDVDWVKLHEWNSPAQAEGVAALNDPVLQEWVRFRCESLAKYAGDLHDYVKSLNPNCVVHFNIKGVYSFNRYWTNAVYQPLFDKHMDVISFDTGGYEARIDQNTGALVSQIRSYKMARGLQTGCEDSMSDDVRAAVHMSFNYQKPLAGFAGAPFGPGAYNVFTPLLEFFREYNQRYYTGTENVADVAVLHNWPSMAYSISATYVPVTLMEQVLIQHKVPFDLLFDEQLDRLPKYAAVILAGQECVSNAQAQTLLAYVRNGGTLVLTGNTGQYNEWRERRRVNPLLPARTEGKGRIIYIPEIIRGEARVARAAAVDVDPEPGATAQRGERLNPPQWVLPRNHQEIYQTIVDGLPRGLSMSTDGPITMVSELLNRASTTETIAHFINFDRRAATAPFHVTLKKQYAGKVKAVTCFSPDADEPVSINFEESGDQVKFTVPATRLYSMIVVGQ